MPTRSDPFEVDSTDHIRRLVHAILKEGVPLVAGPYAVMCTDDLTGYVALIGPYPDGTSARAAARWEDEQMREIGESGFRFRVLPLSPPTPIRADGIPDCP